MALLSTGPLRVESFQINRKLFWVIKHLYLSGMALLQDDSAPIQRAHGITGWFIDCGNGQWIIFTTIIQLLKWGNIPRKNCVHRSSRSSQRLVEFIPKHIEAVLAALHVVFFPLICHLSVASYSLFLTSTLDPNPRMFKIKLTSLESHKLDSPWCSLILS